MLTTIGLHDSQDSLASIITSKAQLIVAICVILALCGAMLYPGILIIYVAIIFAAIASFIVSRPILALSGYVLCCVGMTLIGKTSGGEKGFSTYALGSLILLIIAYWFIRIRVLERQPLTKSPAMLLLFVFWGWAGLSTALGLMEVNRAPQAAIEILHLTPILFLPLLYERFVAHDSKEERWLFLLVLIVGSLTVVWNIVLVRTSVVQSLYINDVGRGNTDETLGCLFLLLGASFLLSVRKPLHVFLSASLFLLGLCGLVISFRRTLYLASLPCLLLIFSTASASERKTGAWRMVGIACLLIVIGTEFYFSSRVFRLLLTNYGLRFASSKNVTTDLSLMERYSEWRHVWAASLHTPVLGNGFGSEFRQMNLMWGFHFWQPFTHNSYLYYFFKTGLIGVSLFFGVFALFLAKGYRLARSSAVSGIHRIITRAAVAYLMLLCIGSYTDTYLEHRPALVWTGLIWGYYLSLEKSVARVL